MKLISGRDNSVIDHTKYLVSVTFKSVKHSFTKFAEKSELCMFMINPLTYRILLAIEFFTCYSRKYQTFLVINVCHILGVKTGHSYLLPFFT